MPNQQALIQQIKESHLFAPSGAWDFKETQLSYVFLTADKAYKIKKALDIGSLRLSQPENRRIFCKQEMATNQDISPRLYLGLKPIYRRRDGGLTFEGEGEADEYALEMNRFCEDTIFLKMLESGSLEEAHLTQLTDIIARNHQEAEKSPKINVYDQTADNIAQTLEGLAGCPDIIDKNLLENLRRRFDEELEKNKARIKAREKTHTKFLQRDLSLEGVCLHEGVPMVFDSMPAHKPPQSADTMADLATLVIDLFFQNRRDLASVVLNRYLKRTDDFDGLPLLRLYGAQQALQRSLGHCATCLELKDPRVCAQENKNGQMYAELALLFMRETPAQRVVAIGGLSGAGKTTLGRAVAQKISAIHIRADAVRKHLYGMPVFEKAPPEAYRRKHNKKTYDGLEDRARMVLDAGLSVVVDGVFAKEADRDGFSAFAHKRGLPYTAVWCMVPPSVAQKRIAQRLAQAGKPQEEYDDEHEKQLFLNPGRISWHRLDALYGAEQLQGRLLDLIDLSG